MAPSEAQSKNVIRGKRFHADGFNPSDDLPLIFCKIFQDTFYFIRNQVIHCRSVCYSKFECSRIRFDHNWELLSSLWKITFSFWRWRVFESFDHTIRNLIFLNPSSGYDSLLDFEKQIRLVNGRIFRMDIFQHFSLGDTDNSRIPFSENGRTESSLNTPNNFAQIESVVGNFPVAHVSPPAARGNTFHLLVRSQSRRGFRQIRLACHPARLSVQAKIFMDLGRHSNCKIRSRKGKRIFRTHTLMVFEEKTHPFSIPL